MHDLLQDLQHYIRSMLLPLVNNSGDYAMAARDRHFFDPRRKKAIADYINIMADPRFQLNHEL